MSFLRAAAAATTRPTTQPLTSALSRASPPLAKSAAATPSTTRAFSAMPARLNDNNAGGGGSSSSYDKNAKTLIEDRDNGFGFVRHNPRPPKPREVGVTEIRGPYYSAMGPNYLSDVLRTMGPHVDGLKFAGGSFSLFQEQPLRELVDLAHQHGVYVSTGGWMEHVLASASGDVGAQVDGYLRRCKELGMDVIEISTGFLSLPPPDWLRLVDRVHSFGLKAKPELGIQFGAGGDTDAADLEAMGGTSDPSKVTNMAKQFMAAGVERMMIESEGITENVKSWRTDVIQAILRDVPLEKVMFEAADPKVFNWYIREFGVDVNLFVDHSQIVQLSCLRQGIWGMADTFGKITTYRPSS